MNAAKDCYVCGGERRGGLTLPWEDGDNAYTICPHRGTENVQYGYRYSEDDD